MSASHAANHSLPSAWPAPGHFDAIVIGAGFSGLYMLHKLRSLGLSVRVIERGSGVGGTWFWNRYPGARCDIESMQYSYSFSEELDQDWNWTERFAPQPEILRYANHVADRFDLRRDIELNTAIVAATFDEAAAHWTVTTDRDQQLHAKYLVMATGCLSVPSRPHFEGLKDFGGKLYTTSGWPHEGVDFSGQRVAVIGTGSSAIQSIPIIAAQAKQLTVFQRTPNFSIPAHNAPLTQEQRDAWKSNYPALRKQARETTKTGVIAELPDRGVMDDPPQERQRKFEARWQRGGLGFTGVYNDCLLNKEANEVAAEFVRNKIGEIVRDPKTAAILKPYSFPIGTKRLCVDTNYYATFNRDNVALVDLNASPIERMTANGIKTGAHDYEFDAIVFATGFDAMTGALTAIDIRGRGGRTLRDKWAEGPRNYLGLMPAGFPNLFTITGPGSPSVLSNMMVSIEQHVDWIADCICHMRRRNLDLVEADVDAEDAWVDRCNKTAAKTLRPQANSWYMGANIPGKPRVFMPYVGGVDVYRKICNDVATHGYEGFAFTPHTQTASAAAG